MCWRKEKRFSVLHLLRLSRQASIAVWTAILMISKPWWRLLKPKRWLYIKINSSNLDYFVLFTFFCQSARLHQTIHIYLSIYLSQSVPIYLSIYLSVYISISVCSYLSIYLYIYTHTHIYIYIYIYIYISVLYRPEYQIIHICLDICLSNSIYSYLSLDDHIYLSIYLSIYLRESCWKGCIFVA